MDISSKTVFSENKIEIKEEKVVEIPEVKREEEKVKEEPTWQESERNSITIFKSDAMTIVLIGLHAQAELKPHKANGTISVQVLEGKITFATEYERAEIEKGQMIALQPNITHSVVATTESFFLLTLVPDRI